MGKNKKLQSVVSPLASYIYPYISSGFVDHTRSQLHFQPHYLMYMCRYNELGQGWEHGGAWIDVNKEDTWKPLLQCNSGPPVRSPLSNSVLDPCLFHDYFTRPKLLHSS